MENHFELIVSSFVFVSYCRNRIKLYYSAQACKLFNVYIELPGPGYQNVINREDYNLQYHFELFSEFIQLFDLSYLFQSFPNTEMQEK